jgi:hypothetical protein
MSEKCEICDCPGELDEANEKIEKLEAENESLESQLNRIKNIINHYVIVNPDSVLQQIKDILEEE